MTVAAVTLWGSRIAAVSIDAGARYATFQYDPAFVRSGIEVAPVAMPLRAQPYSFPGLPHDAFSGLPSNMRIMDLKRRLRCDSWGYIYSIG